MSTCPNCGYCPHCKRAAQPANPWAPITPTMNGYFCGCGQWVVFGTYHFCHHYAPAPVWTSSQWTVTTEPLTVSGGSHEV